MILSLQDTFRLLKKLPTSQIAELSNLSNAYISQVKHGKRPPSVRLIEALDTLDRSKPDVDYIGLFLKSRSQGLSPNTVEFYRRILANSVKIAQPTIAPSKINTHLKSINGNSGNKYAHFRAFRAFFHWLYSPKSGIGINPQDNPMLYVEAPKVRKLILPSLTREQVESLITKTNSLRDKAIVALFTESGLRLSELANMKLDDVDWQNRIIKSLDKGGKEAYAPFGSLSERYLKAWLKEYQPKASESIWGLTPRSIQYMLKSLSKETGLPCNPHTFRRTFACLLRKAGVDTMTIKDLGRWESLEMVQRYTRSVSFQDSMRFYKAPLS